MCVCGGGGSMMQFVGGKSKTVYGKKSSALAVEPTD